jgi:hypothetical protein
VPAAADRSPRSAPTPHHPAGHPQRGVHPEAAAAAAAAASLLRGRTDSAEPAKIAFETYESGEFDDAETAAVSAAGGGRGDARGDEADILLLRHMAVGHVLADSRQPTRPLALDGKISSGLPAASIMFPARGHGHGDMSLAADNETLRSPHAWESRPFDPFERDGAAQHPGAGSGAGSGGAGLERAVAHL